MTTAATSTEEAPGPSRLELPRWIPGFLTDTFRTANELVRRHRPVARLPAVPNFYLFSTPDAAKHVLQDNHRNYRKADSYEKLEPLVGQGLLTSDGDLWLRQRRLVAPMFHRDRVHSMVDTMREAIRDTLREFDAIEEGETFECVEAMSRLTLSTIGRVLFNRDIGRESDWIKEGLDTVLDDVNQRVTSPICLPRWVPTPNNLRVQGIIEDLESMVHDLIEQRRGNEEDYDDLLSMLMLAEDEETGERMSDRQLRDEAMTFILAGHETTMNLVAWTFYLLSEHPETRARVEEEVDEVVSGEIPTLSEVPELEFTEQVLDETLRLYPPAWSVGRTPREDDVVEGYRVPAGSIVSVGPYFVHHNPDVWEAPETFDPDRFGPDGEVPDHRYAHFPFGGGPRKCVGADFAMQEAKLLVAGVVGNFRLDLVDGHPVEPVATVTITPKYGLEMTASPRHG